MPSCTKSDKPSPKVLYAIAVEVESSLYLKPVCTNTLLNGLYSCCILEIDFTVLCFDAMTGKRLWTYSYECEYSGVGYPAGPRASVVIDGDRAYSLGTMGHVFCFQNKTGKILWSKFLKEEYPQLNAKTEIVPWNKPTIEIEIFPDPPKLPPVQYLRAKEKVFSTFLGISVEYRSKIKIDWTIQPAAQPQVSIKRYFLKLVCTDLPQIGTKVTVAAVYVPEKDALYIDRLGN